MALAAPSYYQTGRHDRQKSLHALLLNVESPPRLPESRRLRGQPRAAPLPRCLRPRGDPGDSAVTGRNGRRGKPLKGGEDGAAAAGDLLGLSCECNNLPW